MRFNRLTGLAAGCVVVLAGAVVSAQTLADIAKKEEERRKQAPTSGKIYTNKDLASVPPPSTPPADPSATLDPSASGEPATGKPDAGGEKAAGEKPAADAAEKSGAKDQKYWKERMSSAQLTLERDSGYAEAMQTRINALTTDFVNRDDPAQRGVIERNRNSALSELDRLKKQIDADKKAITDLEEEARRAGVPPGWLR